MNYATPIVRSTLAIAAMLVTWLASSATPLHAADAPIEVALTGKPGAWQLLRDGKPYEVRGVGGDGSLELLAKCGGNSIRTWGDEGLGEKLDAAHKLGLTVTAGIWLGQVRQGFDWSDAKSLIGQREHIREVVEKYRNHPALLMWSLGNEMEDPEGRNGAVWSEINNLARMVKSLDPKHPTMTVIAEIGGDKVKNLHALCPDLDIVGINSYAGAASLGDRYSQLGGTKPYLLTEFGPPGIWEIQKNEIQAFPELTSSAKSAAYRAAYEKNVIAKRGVCLGSYAFLWGQKQEVTATWFTLILADGSRLGAVDVLEEMWTGKAPQNRAPTIDALSIDGAAMGKPGSTLRAKLVAGDPDQDKLAVEWTLRFDPEMYGSGGDHEDAPAELAGAIVSSSADGAEVKLPAEGGLYRLFAVVRDGRGSAAVANVPFRVDAPTTIAMGKKQALPFVIDDEAVSAAMFVPAGWMGNAKAIRMDEACKTDPKLGKKCIRCEFAATEGWGGVVWQSPAQDWGDARGGADFSGAKQLTFWARGEQGGEVVNFSFGVLGKDKKFFDTASGELPKVSLTSEWRQYSIPVEGKDLARIKTGFVWTVASEGKPVVFYLDQIEWK